MTRFRTALLSTFAASGLLLAGAAAADAPVIGITAPPDGSVIEASSFPATAFVTASVQHAPVSALRMLSASDGAGTVFNVNSGGVGNPFDGNSCTNILTAVDTCTVFAGNGSAVVGFDWTVATPGTHTLTVAGQHGPATGSASIEVTFVLVAGDSPAPPAIANAYLRANHPNLTRGEHGCIIREIAHNHADGLYGEAPYDIDAIHADVEAFLELCAGA